MELLKRSHARLKHPSAMFNGVHCCLLSSFKCVYCTGRPIKTWLLLVDYLWNCWVISKGVTPGLSSVVFAVVRYRVSNVCIALLGR